MPLSKCKSCKYVHWDFGWKNQPQFWECKHIDRQYTFCKVEIQSRYNDACGPNHKNYKLKIPKNYKLKLPKIKLPKWKIKWQ